MVYLRKQAVAFSERHRFRTTNCYGLSIHGDTHFLFVNEFPYNELLWFIKVSTIGVISDCLVSVQRIVMVYLKARCI